ncbi:hypothetical protein HYC85_000203 [Camellia sinensis]|uniref:tRNA (guanine(46)-N(7))-methyltransferase n=1 Tax=Camellia sinensis TaxID=4442 RepID=A0A7J7I3I6_CAMSI|nr:hypothetical protein HYC85_000203 [Camellia sinensis]
MVDIGSDFLCGLQKEIWIRRIIWDLKYGRKYGDRFLGYQILLRIPLVKRAEHWVNELALRNIHFMFANATVSFKQLISTYPGPLMLVSILCPDPHFKKKYHKRRVLQKPLVESIVDSLMPRGQVFIQSDVLEVALDMREKFDAVSDELMHIDKIDTSMLCDDEGWLVSNPMGIRTEREIHAEFEGAKIYRRICAEVAFFCFLSVAHRLGGGQILQDNFLKQNQGLGKPAQPIKFYREELMHKHCHQAGLNRENLKPNPCPAGLTYMSLRTGLIFIFTFSAIFFFIIFDEIAALGSKSDLKDIFFSIIIKNKNSVTIDKSNLYLYWIKQFSILFDLIQYNLILLLIHKKRKKRIHKFQAGEKWEVEITMMMDLVTEDFSLVLLAMLLDNAFRLLGHVLLKDIASRISPSGLPAN